LLLQHFIRKRRNELGLTQQQLADKAGFSLNVVQRFEDNKPYDPHGRTFLRMVKALEVECETLLFECEWK
jgi:predicted transcriptional regulator